MINLILYSILSIIIITPLGTFVNNQNDYNILNYTKNLIYGFIFLSFIALVLNFFFPLNKFINTIILLIPLIIILRKFSYFFNLNFLKFLIINSIIIFLLIAKSNVYRPDAYLYHLPFVDILNHNKIIIGLSNLHYRFGHISIIQYTSSIFNNYIFLKNGIFFSLAIIASAIITNFIFNLINSIKKNKYDIHFFFVLFVIIFISYKMNRYGEYGNDAPTHFMFFYLISEILRSSSEKNYNIPELILISAFILMNKITMGLSIILPLLLFKKFSKSLVVNKINFFTLIFLFLWFIKNILISGCIVYPIKSLCLSKLNWTDIKLTEKVSVENEAWTKGWIDQKDENKFSTNDYIKDFNWIETWSQNHLKKINSIVTPYIVFLLIIFFILLIRSKKNDYINISLIYIYLISLLGIFSLVWFLKVPVFRYGYSYIISFVCLILAYFSYSRNNLENKKIFICIIFLCISIFVIKNSIRIFDPNKNFAEEIWPKIKLFSEKKELKEVKLNNFTYYESPSECGFGYPPCTNYQNLKLKSNIINSYVVLKKLF